MTQISNPNKNPFIQLWNMQQGEPGSYGPDKSIEQWLEFIDAVKPTLFGVKIDSDSIRLLRYRMRRNYDVDIATLQVPLKNEQEFFHELQASDWLCPWCGCGSTPEDIEKRKKAGFNYG